MHANRGVQPVLTLLVAIGGAVVAAAGFLYTCFPSEFMRKNQDSSTMPTMLTIVQKIP